MPIKDESSFASPLVTFDCLMTSIMLSTPPLRLDIDGGLHFDHIHGNVLIAYAILSRLKIAGMTGVADQILFMKVVVSFAINLVRMMMMMMRGYLHAFRSNVRTTDGPELQKAGTKTSNECFEHGEADANQSEVDLDGAVSPGETRLEREGSLKQIT